MHYTCTVETLNLNRRKMASWDHRRRPTLSQTLILVQSENDIKNGSTKKFEGKLGELDRLQI